MSIANHLTNIATSLNTILEDCNIALTSKGAAVANNLNAISSNIETIKTGEELSITVSGTNGTEVTATDGISTVTGIIENESVSLIVPNSGTWNVSGVLDGETSAISTVMVVNEYFTNLAFLPPVGKALSTYTWSEISAVSSAGQAVNYWSVGDRKAVTLNGVCGDGLTFNNEIYYAYIIGIDHNSEIEGANRIHFQFGYSAASQGYNIAFVDSGYNNGFKTTGSWFNMNNTNSNAGGWEKSLMRTIICPAFKNCLPTDLQNVLKSIVKYTDNVGESYNTESCVTSTTDEIFLLAEYEMIPASSSSANDAERNYQKLYTFYENGGEKSIWKYKHNQLGTYVKQWLRSPLCTSNERFLTVSAGVQLSASNSIAYYCNGFAPAFCV